MPLLNSGVEETSARLRKFACAWSAQAPLALRGSKGEPLWFDKPVLSEAEGLTTSGSSCHALSQGSARPASKRPWLRRTAFLVIATLALLLGTSAVAWADPESTNTRLTLSLPATGALGELTRIEARLETEDGLPLPRATVRFYISAVFLSGSGGLVRIGEATTDEGGNATLDYVPRRGGEIEMVVRYAGSDRYAPSQAIATLSVEGNEQLYTPEVGLRVPFISKWFVVGVLSVIWGTFMFVGLLIYRVATASD